MGYEYVFVYRHVHTNAKNNFLILKRLSAVLVHVVNTCLADILMYEVTIFRTCYEKGLKASKAGA